MNEELHTLLTNVAIGALIGTVVGVVMRYVKPEWARRWQKFVLNRQWKLFTAAAILFGVGAIILWHEGQVYTATTSTLLCILELVALVKYGFKPLTPEMERMIDAT